MIDVESKDKVLEVVGIQHSGETPESKPDEPKDTNVLEAAQLVEEVAQPEVADPPKHIPLTEQEYSTVAKTVGAIQELRKMEVSDDARAQINFPEMSIWDDFVKRFGFSSVESAQSAGYTFGLKRLFVIECNKK